MLFLTTNHSSFLLMDSFTTIKPTQVPTDAEGGGNSGSGGYCVIFAKEVRLGTYSNEGPPPPGVAVATRRMLEDPNDEPQYGERIPYVIARGEPGSRLVDRAISPHELFRDR